MKTNPPGLRMACILAWLAASDPTVAQNTTFTYQGRLTANGAPQAGSSDFSFTLYDAASGGVKVGGPLTTTATSDANGVFTVTLDFGSAPFEGQPRWLEISVRASGGSAFTTLAPRQPVTASPYAVYATTPTGAQGQPGSPGSVWRQGSGAPANSTGIDGDYYLDGSTGNVYLRSAGNYAAVANIKGAQGQPGVTGLNGQNGLPGTPGSVWREGSGAPANATGIDGDYYLDGSTGNVYLRSTGTYAVVANIKGAQGQPGVTGLNGQNGLPGTPGSVWREGSGAPSNSLGIDGDYYLDGSTGNVHVRSTGSYAVVANIKGAQGQPGVNGLNGQNGQAGTPGSVWREGSGAPANSLGIDGDYYLDGLTGNVHVRSTGSYAVVANIKGAQGQPGLVALPFTGAVATNIPAFKVTNFGSGDAVDAFTGTGYGVFGEATSSGGWGGLFRYGSDGNNSAYLGANGIAGSFYGPVTVNGSTSTTLFEAKNSGSGGYGVAVRGDSPSNGAYSQLGVSTPGIDPGSIVSYGVYGNGGSSGYAAWFDGQVAIQGQGNSVYLGANGSAAVFTGTVTVSGNVGVGTSSPGAPLDVVGNQGYVRLLSTGSANGSVLELRNDTVSPSYIGAINFSTSSSTPGQIGYESDNALHFRTGSFDNRMVLNASGLYVNGTFVSSSDRNAKENFATVNTSEILEKVARLPLESWNYKNDHAGRHLGPMAQDFRAAFALGSDDKGICTVDADGVALASIQALNQKIEEKDTEIQSLKRRVDEMERLLRRLAPSRTEHH